MKATIETLKLLAGAIDAIDANEDGMQLTTTVGEHPNGNPISFPP
jgi:hypothetical protein